MMPDAISLTTTRHLLHQPPLLWDIISTSVHDLIDGKQGLALCRLISYPIFFDALLASLIATGGRFRHSGTKLYQILQENVTDLPGY